MRCIALLLVALASASPGVVDVTDAISQAQALAQAEKEQEEHAGALDAARELFREKVHQTAKNQNRAQGIWEDMKDAARTQRKLALDLVAGQDSNVTSGAIPDDVELDGLTTAQMVNSEETKASALEGQEGAQQAQEAADGLNQQLDDGHRLH
eukprot:TRINITY_DN6000_c0_g1_i1.p1 TRINITY_DN6000_c0_g1~~TRINITY_DN6000_c0_g1_i1.p1  ORF type:complete len:153 (+),score=53.77 TRINITY_DN6000_c0_g1_i1:184-642(+)